MNEYFLREGFASYYVVKKEQEYPYEQKILADQKCKAVLPFEIRRVDEESYYYFDISGYCPLKQKMQDKKNSVDDYQKIYGKILEAVSEIEGYLLPPEGILMESHTIFLKEPEQKICFCYIPGRKKDLIQQLLDLTEEFLEMINYEDKKLVTYLYQIHEMISNGTIPDFYEKTEEIPEEKMNLYFDDEDEAELWESEERTISFFKEEAEVKRSGKWYMEIGILLVLDLVLIGILFYEMYKIYMYGWNIGEGKRLMICLTALVVNTIYFIKKVKIKTLPEKFTTILTEEESIDKIGES